MATIQLQNIGPIVDTGVIELRAINLFIGKQSSGKSTLLKILCFCRWIDKQVAIGSRRKDKSASYVYSHYSRFIKELMHFYRFNESFFTAHSQIHYNGDAVEITI